MSRSGIQWSVLWFALIFCLEASTVFGQRNKPSVPDFLAGDKIPAGYPHDWNLGPTGARGWIYSNRLETTEARQILVTKVDPKSPADGILNKGDVIIGINAKPFSYDPRTELGKAIGMAEAKSGRLKLDVWRDGSTKRRTLKLKPMGKYSASAPFDCSKSEQIYRQGCDELARRMQTSPNAGNKITRCYNTLALLASGRKEFLPIIKEQVAWAANYSDVECRSLCCWYYGPVNLLLAEYTLATGDTTYLPDLKRVTMEIVSGQSKVGSWGHRFSRPDGMLRGYGMMNAPGLPITLSLVLAREAGVSDPKLDEAIEKSVRLIRFYVGKGCVPYGDHHPWTETHDDNGKNGVAAVLFNALGDTRSATYFSRMSVASHSGEREMGHTGNFFNMLWAMPGVALSGPRASGEWMKEFGWYYDLARRWDGSFTHQGPAQPRNDSYNNWDSSGAYLLAYAQPLRKLHITGKKSNVVSQVKSKEARSLIGDGKGYSHRLKNSIYTERSIDRLFRDLTSWSPVVRERAARALARNKGDFNSRVTKLLQSSNRNSQLGGCEAVKMLKGRASSTVPQLKELLQSEELWLRIKAADALASIGPNARSVIPELLTMLQHQDLEKDPRGMQQRYLCFALFDRRDGLLRGSLDDIDRDNLFRAVRSGLQNEDGRARSTISNIYKNLSFEEIQPLLPAILDSVATPAPSGNMFADGIRLSGLEVLSKHRIQEALPLCLDLIELDRWGSGKRVGKCLAALENYGSAAKDVLPQLRSIKEQIAKKKRLSDNDKKHLQQMDRLLVQVEADDQPVELRSLKSSQ